MKAKALVFSLSSLDLCCRHPLDKDWLDSIPTNGSWGVLVHKQDDSIYVLDASPNLAQTKVIIDLEGKGYFDSLNPNGLSTMFQRMYYVAKSIKHPRAWFPDTWDQYAGPSLVSIFAYPMGTGNERIIANMIRPAGDAFFCLVTTRTYRVTLEDYEPDQRNYNRAIASYKEAAQSIREQLLELDKPQQDGVFNLSDIAFGGVSDGRTYSNWLPLLSEEQRRFVQVSPDNSQKLRGPAGTGKTLAMAMKALHELYRSEESMASPVRILYVTHSWGVAEQVSTILDQLDEHGTANQIDVVPLLTLAQLHLENDKIHILGEDSYEGKQAQLRALAALVEKMKRGEWNTYEYSCSQAFADRFTMLAGTPEANRLLWDLMLEFSCVIGANGIMPGFASEQKYKQIERRPWMMPLENDADKEVVFKLYSLFISDLVGKEEMTTDQAINDFLNKLATFRWYSQRTREGYDMIFVDEFHLFNRQERMVFHNLTKQPNDAPVVFMAMDPRQSPSETYAEFIVPGMESKSGSESDLALGTVASINLKIVYRYTPQILAFIQFIDRFFPNLQLGDDWEISISDANAQRESGPVPQLHFLGTEKQEIEAAVAKAIALSGEGHSVAVLCLDAQTFAAYKEHVSTTQGLRFGLIESQNDIGTLRYQKKTIMLSQPQYVAGLQFGAVIIGGFKSEFKQYNPNQAYNLRRFLSDFYLGASRARDVLHLFSSVNQSDLPDMLNTAVEDKLLELVN